jgi:hypothetical protein
VIYPVLLIQLGRLPTIANFQDRLCFYECRATTTALDEWQIANELTDRNR